MSGSRPVSRPRARGRAAGLALGLLAALAGAAAGQGAPAPARVVSLNLCTDLLALELAAPGQLAAVTALAQDPRESPLAEAAAALPAHHGRAEEVYALRPDLVLASDFTAPATLALLRRLGIRVETFAPAMSLADIPAQLRRMGALLGSAARAEALASGLEARLAALAAAPGPHPRAVIYEANGYASGSATLAGDILAAGGFANAADEAGLAAGGFLPLERLAALAPAAIVVPGPAPGASRGHELLAHPVVRRLAARGIAVPEAGRDWTCAAPAAVAAAEALAAARRQAPPPAEARQ